MNITQTLYKIIYNKHLNYILRNLNLKINNVFKTTIKLPPSGTITLKTDSGIIKILTNQTSYISQLIFWNGYKKFEYSEIFESLTKQVNCFLDIGANIGYYSLLAAKSNPNINVYAFEPAKGPKYYLQQNITANNFSKNIKAIDLALSETSGDIEFYEVENKKYKYLKYNLAGEGNAGTKTTSRNFIKNVVKTQTLDSFLDSKNEKIIDLIKLDTEGTEVNILKTGIEAIKKHQPIIICETLFNTIENELEIFFKALNYKFYNHTEDGLKCVESINRIEDNGVRNCFFVPESKVHIIKSFVI